MATRLDEPARQDASAAADQAKKTLENLERIVKDARADWQKDGHGIRGPQPATVIVEAGRRHPVRQTADYSSRKNSDGAPAASPNHPWKIIVESSTTIRLQPGTINSFLPTNMFSTFGISSVGTYYVILDCSSDGTVVTSASISVGTSPPASLGNALEMAPTFFQILLGVVVDGTAYNVEQAALNAVPRAGVQTLRSPLSPGEPYRDINYNWLISAA